MPYKNGEGLDTKGDASSDQEGTTQVSHGTGGADPFQGGGCRKSKRGPGSLSTVGRDQGKPTHTTKDLPSGSDSTQVKTIQVDIGFILLATPAGRGGFVGGEDTTTRTAPLGALDQMGHSLQRLIHAFAETGPEEKVFLAKWDIKDGFWRLDCKKGEEWNFAYVLPQELGRPITLVVPTSLQKGWVESPPYFCAPSETAREVAAVYCETQVGSLPDHKFLDATQEPGSTLRLEGSGGDWRYLVEVYVNDFITMVVGTSEAQLQHVANAVMHGIHDVFPPEENEDQDPISAKKLGKGDGVLSTTKCVVGFNFDGVRRRGQPY